MSCCAATETSHVPEQHAPAEGCCLGHLGSAPCPVATSQLSSAPQDCPHVGAAAAAAAATAAVHAGMTDLRLGSVDRPFEAQASAAVDVRGFCQLQPAFAGT